jgi:hypothetical protein
MATEQRVSAKFKEQTETRTVFVLSLLGLLFAFFFLPHSVLLYLKDGLTSIGSVLGTVSLLGATGGVLGYVISAQDRLATGNSRAALFFQAQYPRKAIQDHYTSKGGCTEEQATYLWFKIYNPWEKIGPMMDPYSRTFGRSYACRFIFVLQWSFLGFFVISLVTWAASFVSGYWTPLIETQGPVIGFARILLLIFSLAAFTILFFENKPKENGTGCWKLWYEINGIHKTWLKTEVFDGAATYVAALTLIDDTEWRRKHGYPALV